MLVKEPKQIIGRNRVDIEIYGGNMGFKTVMSLTMSGGFESTAIQRFSGIHRGGVT
jgi:hypothetical protein